MSAAMAKALIVVLTYNEHDNVRGVAERFLCGDPGCRVPLFVDDNLLDGTGALL